MYIIKIAELGIYQVTIICFFCLAVDDDLSYGHSAAGTRMDIISHDPSPHGR